MQLGRKRKYFQVKKKNSKGIAHYPDNLPWMAKVDS